jgi:hypothetical protein
MKNLLVILVLISCCSCGTYSYLPKPSRTADYVFGSTMEVRVGKGGLLKGEFLGLRGDTAYIKADHIYKMPMSDIHHARILFARTSETPAPLIAWASVLPLSVIAHGYFAFLTLPLNLLVCIPVGCTASTSVYAVEYPSHLSREELPKFARFPQGIPDQLTMAKAVSP